MSTKRSYILKQTCRLLRVKFWKWCTFTRFFVLWKRETTKWLRSYWYSSSYYTAQKMKFSIKNFFIFCAMLYDIRYQSATFVGAPFSTNAVWFEEIIEGKIGLIFVAKAFDNIFVSTLRKDIGLLMYLVSLSFFLKFYDSLSLSYT